MCTTCKAIQNDHQALDVVLRTEFVAYDAAESEEDLIGRLRNAVIDAGFRR